MIVFTAKNNVTNEVYVGSARHCVEEHWAHLIVQAEEGGTGNLLEIIRAKGADQFNVETWGFADSAAESRELIRDACEELKAKPIKTGRAPEAKKSVPLVRKKKSVESSPISKINSAPKRSASSEHGPVKSINISEYQANISDKEADTKTNESVSLRKTESTQIAEDMKSVMIRIEMQRKKNMKSYVPPKKAAKKSTATKSRSSTLVDSKTLKLKLPDGRVSSQAKEKKIKEAIAFEREQRLTEKSARVAAEADEMAALLARLDQKTQETNKLKRRR